MKRILSFTTIFTLFLALCACDPQQQHYNDVPQIAFALKTYSFNVNSAVNSVTIPVQLIAKEAQGAITGTVSVNSASTCAGAVTVPTSVTIDAGRFLTNLVITVNHGSLNAGNANRLILDLSASGVKVAGNYKQVTITLNKQ